MNAPHIQFVTQSNTNNSTNSTNTEPVPEPEDEPEDTPRRVGIFLTIWRFLCQLVTRPFSKLLSSSDNSFNSESNDDDLSYNQTLFFGTEQVTSINQNPIVAVFRTDTQQLIWCYNAYEVAGADGRAIGALHARTTTSDTQYVPDEVLYVVLTIDGTQGTIAEDVRRFTSDAGWIPSYGSGGGPKVSVVVQINTTTGEPITGTFVRSQLPSNGRTNSLVVTQMSYERNCNVSFSDLTSPYLLRVQAEAYYLPMSLDGHTPLNETKCLPDTNSPFNYTVTLSPSLHMAYTADCRTIENPTTSC